MGFLFEDKVGQQEQVAYNFSADVNERNAKAADQEAAQLIFTEEQNIVKFREDISDLQDATNQAFRRNGWIAEEGTPLKVALANAQEADAEIETRRYNAAVGAQTTREKGVEQRLQGTLNRMYGKAARTRGRARAVTSLIQTGSAIAGAM